MKKLWLLAMLPLLSLVPRSEKDFINHQKTYPAVQIAYEDKQEEVASQLKKANLSLQNLNILISAFKAEQELDLYVKAPSEKKYRKLLTYKVCATSGQLGPKRMKGDAQIPEGFYYIDRFNPHSFYFLSLGLNYPNRADQILGAKGNLGGDIFIHGNCLTIGCLPMTDDYIKEIYIYALQAAASGQKNIPVYMFPFRLNQFNLANYRLIHSQNKPLLKFWDNLKTGYDRFYTTSEALKVAVDPKGNYIFG